MKKLAIILAAVLLFSCFGMTACDTQTEGANLVVNVGPEPDTIDPALNSSVDGATMLIHAFEGLMNLDENGVPIPGQAKSYQANQDGTEYTVTLRDGLKWTDGTDVTAEDFVYSWNRAIDPETAADYEYMFDVIDGYDEGTLNMEAVDAKTLKVTLGSPVPYFLELCAFPTFFPVKRDVIEENGESWALAPDTYISNGPYKMTEWVANSYILFEKNENYWNVKALGPESIKFVLMDDDNAIMAAYKDGSILFADSIPNNEIDAWKNSEEFNLQGQLGTYYVSFNTQNEYLSNPNLRKALTLAIDREFITREIGKAGQVPAGAFVATGLSDADPTKQFREVGGDYYSVSDYTGNLELAKQALVDAGYPNGEGLPTFEYLYNTSTGHQLIGEALKDMWSKIGVNINLVSQE